MKKPITIEAYNPQWPLQYQALKKEVATKHPYNPAYVQAKAPFIEEIIKKARNQP